MKKKLYYKNLIGLEILRRGSYLDRLIAFYEFFGSPNPDRRITIWSPEEIAIVIGMPEGQGVPKGKRLSALRSKITRQTTPNGKIVKEGLLEKVTHNGRYSYRVTESDGLPNEALEILNKKGPRDVTFCRKSQIPYLMAKERMDDLPDIYLWEAVRLKGNDWHEVLPELLDFEEADTWEFWCEKAINAVSGRDHPLRGIEDKNVRLQAALSGLEAGIIRNRERNPEWQPGDPYAWTLHALAKLVGREDQWRTRTEEVVRKSRENAVVKGFKTLRGWAEQAISEMAEEEKDDDSDNEGETELSEVEADGVVGDDIGSQETRPDDESMGDPATAPVQIVGDLPNAATERPRLPFNFDDKITEPVVLSSNSVDEDSLQNMLAYLEGTAES